MKYSKNSFKSTNNVFDTFLRHSCLVEHILTGIQRYFLFIIILLSNQFQNIETAYTNFYTLNVTAVLTLSLPK